MRKIERLFLGLVLGILPPIFGLLTLWWTTAAFLSDHLVIFAAAVGLAAGLFVDFFFLKKWVAGAYDLGIWIWIGIHIFYSIGLFGFFMGVPVFNLALALPAGFFIGSKLAHQRVDSEQFIQLKHRTGVFTTLVMTIICLASAVIALIDPYTAANLQGMFQLSFVVTPMMIIGLIIVGGSVLIIL